MNEKIKHTWYKEGVVYQVYPKSFQDSNNDGIGDIQGIIKRLDYLKELGVSIVWISPIYESPLVDNGYDISDYYKILSDFGTLDDFKELVQEMHSRGLKLVMDLVVNHTSDKHPWFLESKKSVDNPYRDYYYWRKGNEKKKPNNWNSMFGGDAWEYDENTGEYYLHLFAKEQPDLNWTNPKVREEIKKMIRFWLDLGVDGFRCDVINILSKADGLPNGKFSLLKGHEHYINGPHIHDYLQELKRDVFDHYDSFTVGETVLINPTTALSYLEPEELSMLFQFEHMGVDNYFVKWFLRKFKPRRLMNSLSKWQNGLMGKGWNSLYLENHDQPRSLSRFGDEKDYYIPSAKLLPTIIYFQQGTPYIYQGQEIGMTNVRFEDLSDYRDIETHNIYRFGRKTLKLSHKRMMKKIKYMSRDNARTPMQWDDSSNAGFTSATPWIRVNPNYKKINVENNLKDSNSIFHYYQKIISLRKKYPVIVYGDFKEHRFSNPNIYCYERNYNDEKLIVIANYSKKETPIPEIKELSGSKLILCNYENDTNIMKPYEARVYYLKKKV